jgi:hypothetical protein
MARYVLLTSIHGQPPSWGLQKFPRGTTIADSAGNAHPRRRDGMTSAACLIVNLGTEPSTRSWTKRTRSGSGNGRDS